MPACLLALRVPGCVRVSLKRINIVLNCVRRARALLVAVFRLWLRRPAPHGRQGVAAHLVRLARVVWRPRSCYTRIVVVVDGVACEKFFACAQFGNLLEKCK